jgi:hypothetical protein
VFTHALTQKPRFESNNYSPSSNPSTTLRARLGRGPPDQLKARVARAFVLLRPRDAVVSNIIKPPN